MRTASPPSWSSSSANRAPTSSTRSTASARSFRRSRPPFPQSIDVKVAMDQTVTIRASVSDTQKTLMISVLLVILVVFCFLRNARTTLIPSVAVPVSLVGTFGVMYLLGYSLDNLSLMALTISTGFVVDDAIVVIENITRYLEQGMRPFDAALKGAQEIGFTVFTISISLVAVFIPLLLMGGIVGRLFREFAVTLSVAIVVSMVISLTATPMMCAYLLKEQRVARPDVPDQRAGVRLGGGHVRQDAVGRAALSRGDAARPAGDDRAQRLPVHARAQGLLSAAGQRAHPGGDPGRPGHVVPGDGCEPAADGRYHPRRSGRRHGDRIHGRRDVQHRAAVHLAEAARRAEGSGRPDHRAAAAEAGDGAGRDDLSAGRAGSAGRRPAEQRAVSVRDAGRQSGRSHGLRAQDRRGVEERAARHRREQRPAEPRAAVAAFTTIATTAARFGISPQLDRRDALRPVRPAAGVDDVTRRSISTTW